MSEKFKNVSDIFFKNNIYACPYCEKEYNGQPGLYQHMRYAHNKTGQEVYDEFFKKENEGICVICGKPTKYKAGRYLLTCSPECKALNYSQDKERAKKISNSKKIYTTENFIKIAKEIHGDRFNYNKTKCDKGALSKIIVICKEHGEFETTVDLHLYRKNGGCRQCANKSISETKLNYDEKTREAINNKRKQTNLEKFGNELGPNPYGSKEYISIIQKKYGVENPFQAEEIKEKIKQTNLEKYGVDNPAYLEKTIQNSHSKKANQKRYFTHKKNDSFNTSKPEDDFYEYLLTIFNEDDVFRNYKEDSRYPFACDFYIKSIDYFIELNLFFTHGFHLFDENNSEDIKQLNTWKERTNGEDMYSFAIKVWTESDPLKHKYATDNNLNYLVLWSVEEIEEFKKENIWQKRNKITEMIV